MSETSSAGSAKPYACDQCDKLYLKPSLLTQHKRSHSGERPFRCVQPGCDKSFLRKSHLQAHQLSHEQDKPFECAHCGKRVNTRQHLKRHEVTHTKLFVCPVEGCHELFYKHQSLRHHQLSVHDRTLTCVKCNKTFSRPYRLAQHNLKYHSETPVYQCEHTGCFANFKTWSALQLHIRTEHPKLKCPECGKGCVGRKGLQLHMMVHDDARMVRLWNCVYCDVGLFVKKLDLLEHYQAFHDGNVPAELLKRDEEPGQGQFVLVPSDDEEEPEVAPPRDDASESLASTLHLGKTSIIDLILQNYQTKKIPCPKRNCDRMFSREYDLRRHLSWHEAHLAKVESFLESLEHEKDERDEAPSPKRQKVDDDNDEDDDFNNLLNQELERSCQSKTDELAS